MAPLSVLGILVTFSLVKIIIAVPQDDAEGRLIKMPQEPTRQQSNTRRCLGPDNAYGWCTRAARCPLPEFKRDKLRFMDYMDYLCIIDRLYIGVCCPDKYLFQSQLGTTLIGNPAGGGQISNSIEIFGQETVELHLVKDTNGNKQKPPENLPTTKKPTTIAPSPKPGSTPASKPERKGCGLNEKMDVGRVVGGKSADPKEWPWMAAIMRDLEVQFCGGCLITERHVLTAAHCVFKHKPSELHVRLGEHDFTRMDETRPQNVNVSEIRKHRDFDEITYENDIAILKLERTVILNSYVWPACLPEFGSLFVKQSAVVIGWGTIEYGGPVSDKLMEVSVPVWDNSACAEHYVQPIADTNLCAGGQGGKDSCQGDSGGPLLLQLENRRWVTIGVVSWGIKCGEERPAVYTRVNRYLDWIIRNTL